MTDELTKVLHPAGSPRSSSTDNLPLHPSAVPTHLSTVPEGTSIEAALVGSRMLGFDLTPQGAAMASVLEAKDEDGLPLFPQVAGLVPRRAAKTTTVWSVLLGRLVTIPGYRVVTTAQDGTRARRKFREMARTLEARGFEDGVGNIRWANGDEALEFDNGSLLWVVAPHAGAFRSEAADAMLFDEAGELDPVRSEDLLAGALPLLDTRPMGQAIIVGTPAKYRAGLLWDTLAEGRRGDPGAGIFDWSIRDEEESVLWPDGADGEAVLNREVLRRVHPGIGVLTTMARMEQRFRKMDLPTFEREYLCRFPFDASSSAIDLEAWHSSAIPELPRPERFGLAYDVAPDGSSAALCAAWRDEDGNAVLGVLEHRQGVSWLARAVHTLARKYNVPVRYDAIGANHAPAQEIDRMRGVRLVSGNAKEAQAAAQRMVSALADGNLRHFDQKSLTSAAEGAAWRQAEGGRYFARKASANDIAPLVAASLALWEFDQTPERRPITIRRATSA